MVNEYLKIAEQVEKFETVQNLMHCINKEALKTQHKLQHKNKAAGIDKIDKISYEKNLVENIENLVSRMKAFTYKPQAVRRTYIHKTEKEKLRPLGIPAYEDKLVQGVMADILTVIYEPKFEDFSYGFRPGRNCHDAIKELDRNIFMKKTSFIVDADIKGFFDNVNHQWLIKFLEHDIEDKNFIRYIKRFLKSGIIEQGKFIESDKGTPQGGLISPILANIYLHYVLDIWFDRVVKKNFRGEANIVRYADDFVCCFQYESEARKFFEMLRERLKKFGLELAEDKSKIFRFGRFAKVKGIKETFDFLGFTYINSVSKSGNYTIAHKTSKKKLKSKMQGAKEWLHENIHTNRVELVKKLNVKLIGHYRYYGITGNTQKMRWFRQYITEMLYKTLNRRSQKKMNWARFNSFLKYNPIAEPKVYVPLG